MERSLQLMKVQKAAELLDMDPHQVYQLIEIGHLQAVRIGKRGVRIRLDSLETYITQNGIDPYEEK